MKIYLCVMSFLLVAHLDFASSRYIPQKGKRQQQGIRTDSSRVTTRIRPQRWNPSAWFQSRDIVARQRGSGILRDTSSSRDWQIPFRQTTNGKYSTNYLVNNRKTANRRFKTVSLDEQNKRNTNRSPERMFRINLRLNRNQNNKRRTHNINILSANRRHRISISQYRRPFQNGMKGKTSDQKTPNKLFNYKFNTKTNTDSAKLSDQAVVSKHIFHNNRVLDGHIASQSYHKQHSIESKPNRVDLLTGSISPSKTDNVLHSSLNYLTTASSDDKLSKVMKVKTIQAPTELSVKGQVKEVTTQGTLNIKSENIVRQSSTSSTVSVNTNLDRMATEIPESHGEVTTEEPDTPDGTDTPEVEN